MRYLTTTEVARKFGVSPALVRRWKSEGRIRPAMELANGPLYPTTIKRPAKRQPGRKPRT